MSTQQLREKTNKLYREWMDAEKSSLVHYEEILNADCPRDIKLIEKMRADRKAADQKADDLYAEYREALKEQEEQEQEAWNPYADPDYKQEDREFAQMQAVAGWHHVPEKFVL